MNVLFCLVTLAFFPKTDGSELIMETSLNALTFTPRWTLETYPGYQVFLGGGLRFSHAFLFGDEISIGADIGVANRFHITYFQSYTVWGIDDSNVWLMWDYGGDVNFLARVGLPTGRYADGIGRGAYSFEIYTKKADILRRSSICLGYEWIGTNPDKVNYGDKIHLGFEVCSWVGINSYYAFADKGSYFSLHDSPSFAVEISLGRNLTFTKVYNIVLVFEQTILGKDIPLSTGISLRMSRK